MITLLVPHDTNDEDYASREYILNHFCREVQVPVNERNIQSPILLRRGGDESGLVASSSRQDGTRFNHQR